MKHLYDGLLEKQYVGNAIDELHTVKKEFSCISPQKVIWDIEDLSQQPPWEMISRKTLQICPIIL